MTKGSLQELFQKLVKAEEVVKEIERRSSHRSSVTHQFRSRYSQRTPVHSNNYSYLRTTEYSKKGKQGTNAKGLPQKILNVSNVVRKGMLQNRVMFLLLTRLVLIRVNT